MSSTGSKNPKRKNNYRAMLERWFVHSKERAMERYGIDFTVDVQQTLKEDVKNNVLNKLLDIPDSNRAVFRGRLLGDVVTFIFCKKHKVVISFLHNNWVETDTDEFYILKKRKKLKSNKSRRLNKGGNMKVNDKTFRKLKSPRPRFDPEDIEYDH